MKNDSRIIPFFDLRRQYEALRPEVEEAVINTMRTMEFVEGSVVKEFEEEISRYLDVNFVITCGNGTDALRIALKSAGIEAGDEVITSPFSFFATPEAISQIGATPVFADIREDTLNIDPIEIKKKITSKTKAILPVHIFGNPADMEEINKIALEYGLFVIEDACQAIGSEYKGKKIGSLGDLACFSFYPTKNLGCFGDGGMITTSSEEKAVICRAMKAHAAGKMGAKAKGLLTGEEPEKIDGGDIEGNHLYDPLKYYNYFTGYNSRLDSIQAAVLMKKMKYLKEYNHRRNEIAALYNDAFKGLPMKVQFIDKNNTYSCYHQYVIRVDRRDEFAEYMRNSGIGTGAFYPVPLHFQKAYTNLDYSNGSLPVVESVCNQSICLPIYPELTDEEITYIINAVIGFFKKTTKGWK